MKLLRSVLSLWGPCAGTAVKTKACGSPRMLLPLGEVCWIICVYSNGICINFWCLLLQSAMGSVELAVWVGETDWGSWILTCPGSQQLCPATILPHSTKITLFLWASVFSSHKWEQNRWIYWVFMVWLRVWQALSEPSLLNNPRMYWLLSLSLPFWEKGLALVIGDVTSVPWLWNQFSDTCWVSWNSTPFW